MIFLTVGTMYPFDRLVATVDEAVGEGLVQEKVFAQIGQTALRPRHMDYAETLTREAFAQRISEASGIVTHAGMGTILMALDHRKPLLVVPRLERYREVLNDHQLHCAGALAERGYVLAAYTNEEVIAQIGKLKEFVPAARASSQQAIIARIAGFLQNMNSDSASIARK